MGYLIKWKITLLIICISLATLAVDFQFNSNIELNSVYEMDWTKISKYRKSLDCYPTGKSNDNSPLGHEALSVSLFHTGGGTSTVSVDSRSQDMNLGQMSGGINMISANRIEFFINDAADWSAYRHRGDSKCVLREYHWKVTSNKVTGKASVSFRMPADLWLVKTKLTVVSAGDEVNISRTVTGDLHNAILENNEVLIWSSPGQTITLPISIKKNGKSGDLVRFQFEVNSFTIGSKPSYKSWVELQKNLVARGTNKKALAEQFLALGSDLLKDKDGSIQLVNSIGTNDYKALVDWLFTMANSANSEFGIYDSHVKAMSAAVGYYLAMSLLDDLKKFCVSIDLYMPLSDRTVKTNGLAAANYWINRDVRRIAAIQFPEIRAYLAELIRWENNGLLYSDIAKNQTEFSKLRDGYIKIRKYSQLAFDIFGDIKTGLNKSISVFGSLGTSELVGTEINSSLTDLSKGLVALNKQFEKEIMSFTLKNNEKIHTSQVLTALDELERKSKILSVNLLSKVKFVNLDPSQNSNSVLELMTSLLAHQVAIFDKPLKSPFAEPIRKAFAQTDRARHLNQDFRQCLAME